MVSTPTTGSASLRRLPRAGRRGRSPRPEPARRVPIGSYVCRWRLADMRDAGDVMQPGHMDHFGEEVSSEEAVDEILTLRASGS
jgi:hypothetical protein